MTTVNKLLPADPTDYFRKDDWLRLTTMIEPIAKEISRLAKINHMRVRFDSRWPRIRVSKRKLLRVRHADLALQPKYLEDHKVEWDLLFQEVRYFWLWFYKPMGYAVSNSYSTEQLTPYTTVAAELFEAMRSYLRAM